MASGLKAKLAALKGAAPQAVTAARDTGLIVKTSRLPLDCRIYALPPVGLRRIGWSGRTFDIRKCLFLDTETTGLSGGAGTVAFLVGVGYVEGDSFVVEQFMLRDYGDEPELIDRLSRRMEGFDSVCTFNGRCFDMPLLEARFTMCRMRDRWRELEDIDLLYPARRVWKLRMGSCRLARIEEIILGKPREDDLPGSEVPARFFQYLKCGDESLLRDIVDHNRQDIATLATLLILLCDINDRPEQLMDPRDQFSMGKSLERQGELKPAREMYRVSAIPRPSGTIASLGADRVSGMANWRLYHLYRRSGDWESARKVLEQMLNRRQMPGVACVELSKLYEHRFKEYGMALEYATKAGEYADSESEEKLKRRVERISGKQAEQQKQSIPQERGTYGSL